MIISNYMATIPDLMCVYGVWQKVCKNANWFYTVKHIHQTRCRAYSRSQCEDRFRISRVRWKYIFTAVNAIAVNAESVFSSKVYWKHIDEFVRERNRFNVPSVANDFLRPATLHSTSGFTVKIECTSVHCVTNTSVSPRICSSIIGLRTTAGDRISAIFAEKRSSWTVYWRNMSVSTLVSGHSSVDSVHNVLHGVTHSKHICWSHTAKERGSRVTFVRKNSAAKINSRNTSVDTKVHWSRMFAVSV